MALVESAVRRKIEAMYGARAELVPMRMSRDAKMSDAEILVFALFGHPSARFCYVWEDGGRVKTALDHGTQGQPGRSPRDPIHQRKAISSSAAPRGAS